MPLPLTSLILIAAALALLAIAVIWKARARKRIQRQAPSPSRPQPTTAPVQAAQPPAEQETRASPAPLAEVEEVSIFDEIEIYLAYGHIEQAATALRWHLDHHPEDLVQRNRLRQLYIEAGDHNRLAEILEEDFDHKYLDTSAIRDLTLQCLRQDPQNLALRVFAESRLDLGLERIDQELGRHQPLPAEDAAARQEETELFAVHRDLQQAIVHPEPLELSDIPLHAFRREAAGQESIACAAEDALLHGSATLSPLNEEEIRVINALVGSTQLVRLLAETGQWAMAEDLLRGQVIRYPKRLRLHVLLLELLYEQRRERDFAQALLRLYITLWGLGKALRWRLLQLGRQLGADPLYDELENSEGKENRELPRLAEKHHLYVPTSTIPISSPQLVEERLRRDQDISEAHADDPILRDFNMLLDYGQVEEAVDLLEQSALASPGKSVYFLPLLEMYERMQARDRFARFSKKIINCDPQPEEAIMRQLYHLSERLQRGIRATV
ncbi:hypothetical protein [Acidithiobacillus acidisediminis]|uniref:type IV pilus assembly protein FimV n=1 Tax=Acidithiobacillus TaxID=119977 RepID=UPI00200F91BC|nr:hypothetical protein [Acidithiobacillus sp. S30A2]